MSTVTTRERDTWRDTYDGLGRRLREARDAGTLVEYTRPARVLGKVDEWQADVVLGRPAARPVRRAAGMSRRRRRVVVRRVALVTLGGTASVAAVVWTLGWLVGQALAWLHAHAALLVGVAVIALGLLVAVCRGGRGRAVIGLFEGGLVRWFDER